MKTITHLDAPFIQVEGVFNFRSVGGYTIPSNPSLRVKDNIFYRSGELSKITPRGAQVLSALNVNKIVDLRSDTEIGQWKTASPHLANIKVEHISVRQALYFDNEYLAPFLKRFEEDPLNAFLTDYGDILRMLGKAIEAVIRQMLDDPEHSCLVHCTAGKDRTGLVTAVILRLLGVSDADVAEEYALTTIGVQPVYNMLMERLSKVQAMRDNPVALKNLGTSKFETMIAVLNMINDEYGGPEEYVLKVTSLTREDIEALRKQLLVAA